MNPEHSPAPRSSHIGLKLLAAAFLVFILTLGLLVAGVLSFFRLSREARTLRDSLQQAVASSQRAARSWSSPWSSPWDERIELSVGPMTFGAVRAGLSFVQLDPEPRAALRSIRGAEAGIYELQPGVTRPDRGQMLRAADEAMARRGWERLLVVATEGELVTAYVPSESRPSANLRVCLAVFQGRQLVVASARGNIESLLELALSHPEWGEVDIPDLRFSL
jgi:hypothetical protein